MQAADLLAILDQGPIGPEALALMSKAQRRRAQAGIDALIAALDAMAPDPEAEPSLGTPEIKFRENGLPLARGYIDQRRWGRSAPRLASHVDLEEDTADDEPQLGAPEHMMSLSYGHGVDRTCDQTFWSRGGDTDEREHENEHGGDILNERHDEEADEPNLGAPDGRASQISWADGSSDERERDADYEPALGMPEGDHHKQGNWGRLNGSAFEYEAEGWDVDWEDEEDERSGPCYREGMAILAEADKLGMAA